MVTLPRGLLGDVERIDADVRGLTGSDEEYLARAKGPVAETVTELLARCVLQLGGAPATADDLRRLSVGDREALLLHVRQATLGDRVDCVATCPDPACGERLDLTLSVGDVLVERPELAPLAWYDETFPAPSGTDVRVVFRVPTGADQEAVASLVSDDPAAAATALLERCIRETSSADGSPIDAGPIADLVGERMSELDPQAEIRLVFDCAACGRRVSVLFDTASYFFAEIAGSSDRLYQEVHALAWHYHWSEREILRMSREKRRRYLDLIAESVGPRQARSAA
jgi:hypothetical protein